MTSKILIGDPDKDWLYSAKKYFEEHSYEVFIVSNGRDVQMNLSHTQFFAAILSTELQNYTCPQVLKFIKKNCPTLKVVGLFPTQENVEVLKKDEQHLGEFKKGDFEDVLKKPFEMEALRKVLESYQPLEFLLSNLKKNETQGEEQEYELTDEKLTKIKIDEFYSSQSILFDVFIRLGENRYVKILHAGDTMLESRLDKYRKDKEIEYLYFQKTDLHKYIKFNTYFTKQTMDSEKIKSANKVKFLQNVTEKFLEKSFEEGIKSQVIEEGKELAENMYLLIQENKDLYLLLHIYQDFDPNAFTHAYLVSLFSTALIKEFPWQSKVVLECTALACFFHDIGKMQIPRELLHCPTRDMDEEQFEEYKRHPQLGLEMLEGHSLINNSVKQIILQHHEHYDGTGFPQGKRGSKILTLANIVCLADDFVHIIQEKDLSPIEALRTLLKREDQLEWYHSLIVENLIKVFVNPANKKAS